MKKLCRQSFEVNLNIPEITQHICRNLDIASLSSCHLLNSKINDTLDNVFYHDLFKCTFIDDTTLRLKISYYRKLYYIFHTRGYDDELLSYMALYFCQIGDLENLEIILRSPLLGRAGFYATTAAKYGNLGTFQWLESIIVDVDYYDVMKAAIWSNRLNIVEYLVKMNVKMYKGALVDAASKSLEMVTYMVEHAGVNVDDARLTVDGTILRAVEHAHNNNKLDIVDYLIKRGARVNKKI